MPFKSHFYPESTFGGFTDIDGTIAFYIRVNSLIKPSFILLDFGCGRGTYGEDAVSIRRQLRIFKSKVHRVIGVDVDNTAQTNPFLDEFHLLNGKRLPMSDDSIDMCICDNVLEHMEQPDALFSESRRVIKDGGYLCIRTTNSWSYIGLLSRAIPNRFHTNVLAKVQEDRREEDVFPTVYRCNTISRIKAILSEHGFEHIVYGYEAEPSYLSFSRIAYWFGVLHQRFAPEYLRPVIFAFAQARKLDNARR